MLHALLLICLSIIHLNAMPFPIDIVYLWVDGKDPQWRAIKQAYLPGDHSVLNAPIDATSDNRYIEHNELKFSLRSIVRFAPFFRHIYIVTMNQRPKWLLDHPQIIVIDHLDIFKNRNDLPTFNSQAIESHLHRIFELSEHFIYFNDDVFLGKPVTLTDFFSPDGKIEVLFEKGRTFSPNPEVQASSYRQAWVNSNHILDTFYVKEKRHRLCHAPFALRKSFINLAETLFPFVFEITSSHRFRTNDDYNIVNGFLQYVWIYHNLAERGKMTNRMLSFHGDDHLEALQKDLKQLLENPPHTFCLEDSVTGKSEKTDQLLQDFFRSLYPTPAPWEAF